MAREVRIRLGFYYPIEFPGLTHHVLKDDIHSVMLNQCLASGNSWWLSLMTVDKGG